MAFSSGTYTRTDGTRTGSTVWNDAKTASVKILAADHDTHDQDIATALSNTICRDGQSTISANIPFNSKRITGLGAATAVGDAIQASQVQNSGTTYSGTVTGSSSDYAITLAPTPAAYAAGQRFSFLANHESDGNATLNVNSLGAKSILLQDGATQVPAKMIGNGDIVEVVYDGSAFILLAPTASLWIDYSGSVTTAVAGGGSWGSISVTHAKYRITGDAYEYILKVVGTVAQAGGGPTSLFVSAPFTPANSESPLACAIIDNSVNKVGICIWDSSETKFEFQLSGGTQFTTGSVTVNACGVVPL